MLRSSGGLPGAQPQRTTAQLGASYLGRDHIGQTAFVSDANILVVGIPTGWLKMDGTVFSTDPAAVVVPTSVSATPNPAPVSVGGTTALVLNVLPANSTNKAATFSSRNPGIATVSSAGVITGVALGDYTIDITTVSGGATTTVTGTVTAATSVIKAVGVWNPMQDGVQTAAAGLTTVYVPVKMVTGGGDANGLYLNYAAWYTLNTNTGTGTDLGNDLNILEASLQSSTTSAPVMFSGARTGVVPNGGNLISDMITPAALGFTGGVIPVGTTLYAKVKMTIPSGGKIPTSPRNLYNQGNLSGWIYDSTATTVPSVDALANSTTGYAGTKPVDAGNLFAPLLLGVFKDPTVKAFAGWGDSIESGYNDNSAGSLGGGFFQRALAKFPVPAPSINFGISGAKSQSLVTDPRILAYFKYVPDGLHVMVATNDFGITNPPTAAAIKANVDTWISRYKNAPGVKAGVKAVVSRLLPRTTSTDSFVTEANQTINANWNPGEVVAQFNALITTSNYDAVVVNDVVRGTDVSKWIVNGSANYATSDGTHPGTNAGGSALLASTYYNVLQTAWGA